MRNYIVFLLILVYAATYSQVNTVYYDLDQNLISKSDFDALDESIYFKQEKRKDSLKIYFIGNKESHGTLDATQKSQFFSLLEKITSKKIYKEANTLIHFYQEDSPHVQKSIENRKYWRWNKRYPKRINAFIICSKESKIDVSKSKKLHLDTYNIIKRLFLKNSQTAIGHIFIKTDGSFKVLDGASKNIFCLLDSAL